MCLFFTICACAVEAPTVDGSCADVMLAAKTTGNTRVSISYEHDAFELRATTTVAAYPPLTVKLIIDTPIGI